MKRILFVDDDLSVLSATRRMLHGNKEGWEPKFAQGGAEALEVLRTSGADAVVTDVTMPGMSGLDLLRVITQGPFGFLPVIVVTGVQDRAMKRQALELGAQDLLNKPVDYEDLVARLRSVLALKAMQDELSKRNAELEVTVAHRTSELAASRLELIFQLAKAAELRDEETGNHIVRVAMFSRTIALAMGLSAKDCDELYLASALHDIGKIAVPDAVLHKRSRLTIAERNLIEAHCVVGHTILTDRDSMFGGFLPESMHIGSKPPRILALAAEIARSHHEWWNGNGYPDHLIGETIPLSARIVAVADVLDALRSVRPYKEAMTWESALEVIAAGRGTHFDPTIHDAMLSVEPQLHLLDGQMRQDEPVRLLEAA